MSTNDNDIHGRMAPAGPEAGKTLVAIAGGGFDLSRPHSQNLRTRRSGMVHAVAMGRNTEHYSDGSRRTTEPYPVRVCMQTIVNLADSQWTEAPVDCPRCLRAIQQANQAAAARRTEQDR